MNPETTEVPEVPETTQVSEAMAGEEKVSPVSSVDPVAMAEDMRNKLKEIETLAREFSGIMKNAQFPCFDKGEVIANSILAIRHIEDARMRYGKCIQYATTGESSFQK